MALSNQVTISNLLSFTCSSRVNYMPVFFTVSLNPWCFPRAMCQVTFMGFHVLSNFQISFHWIFISCVHVYPVPIADGKSQIQRMAQWPSALCMAGAVGCCVQYRNSLRPQGRCGSRLATGMQVSSQQSIPEWLGTDPWWYQDAPWMGQRDAFPNNETLSLFNLGHSSDCSQHPI